MNYEALNGYVLVIIGLFAVLLYVVMVFAGFSELISRIPKYGAPGKRAKAGRATRIPRKPKKPI